MKSICERCWYAEWAFEKNEDGKYVDFVAGCKREDRGCPTIEEIEKYEEERLKEEERLAAECDRYMDAIMNDEWDAPCGTSATPWYAEGMKVSDFI